jgi:hypothetical protein
MCVNLDTDTAHCGACDNACPSGQLCTNGKCALNCVAPNLECSGACVNATLDPKNCGACGTACLGGANATGLCVASKCLTACNAGYSDCNGKPNDGCELATSTDINNCGACGYACGSVPNAGSTKCVAGECQAATCDGGFGDCNKTFSDGCEADLRADKANCGACGNACAATANVMSTSCAASACAITACNAGYLDCNVQYADGCEVNVNSDSSSCGACGNVCKVGACMSGKCGTVNFGNDKKDVSVATYGANTLFALPINVASNGDIQSFGFYPATASTGHVTMALYTDRNGAPYVLVASTASTVIGTPGAAQLMPPLTATTLTGGTYWIALFTDDSTAKFYYGTRTTMLQAANQPYGDMPPIFPSGVALSQPIAWDFYVVLQ